MVNLTCAAGPAGDKACNLDNPSGWVDDDGTAWIAYVIRGDHNTGMYGFGVAKAPVWSGPYVPLSVS
jgi:hypothetical protein